MTEKKTKTTDGTASTPAGPDVTTITFRGESFVFPSSRGQWPTVAMQKFQQARWVDGVELLLGPAQWRRLNQVAPAVDDFWEFFPVFAKAAGVAKPDADADDQPADAEK